MNISLPPKPLMSATEEERFRRKLREIRAIRDAIVLHRFSWQTCLVCTHAYPAFVDGWAGCHRLNSLDEFDKPRMDPALVKGEVACGWSRPCNGWLLNMYIVNNKSICPFWKGSDGL
jgi:hypothetical protein